MKNKDGSETVEIVVEKLFNDMDYLLRMVKC